jgi:uracil-DNA glycosylase family 4
MSVGKHKRPPGCFACPLERAGAGYVPGEGPVGAPITLLGEFAGYDEIAIGRPLIGAAGGLLSRLLHRTFRTREQFRIENAVRCCPPGHTLKGEWAQAAADHCSQYSNPALEQSSVIVAMGELAIRQALNLWDPDVKKLVENFHGTVTDLPDGRRVVCTYHPNFLRGNMSLFGTVAYDLSVAEDVANGTWQREPITPIIDPHPAWVRTYIDQYRAAIRSGEPIALVTDIETPDKAKGKAEDELDESDQSFQVDRVNFSYHDDEGITVPYVGPYIPLVHELIALGNLHYLWNGDYDLRRLQRLGAQFSGEIWDGMWLWHHYMSDVPKGLGYVAPFCSTHGAWKHKFSSEPGLYAALDGPQTRRSVNRTVEALDLRGQWTMAHRHTVRLMQNVLKPAQVVGIQVDRPALDAFEADLAAKTKILLGQLQECVPVAERPLTGGTDHQGFKKRPEGPHPNATTLKKDGVAKKGAEDWDPLKVELYQRHARLVELQVSRDLRVCVSCGQEDVVAKHRCADKKLTPSVQVQARSVVRYFWQEPFNPDSPKQSLSYILARKHKPGKSKQTKQPSADRECLTRLRATTKDPFYATLLDYRGVAKVRGTYAIGVRKRLDHGNRFHPVPTLKPSTLRTSYVSPNIQNVVADKDSTKTLAAGFRRCIVAAPDCWLVELDYSGIEAMQLAWFARDPVLHRLARLGIHAYLASHLLKRPADLNWSDADLLEYFQELKKGEPFMYNQAKRTVHGNGYGMTPQGMFMMFPDLYKTVKDAQYVQDLYFAVAPAVPRLQNEIRLRAHDQTYIGGPKDAKFRSILDDPNAHPYGYRHDFYDVVTLTPIGPESKRRMEQERIPIIEMNGRLYAAKWGPDSKRCLAFYPQSTAAGNLKEAALYLFDEPDHPSYIGDAYFGKTPLRAPIHDSLLLEVPDKQLDRVLEAAFREMVRPIEEQPLPAAWNLGPYLTIGVEGKRGRNWEDMEKVKSPTPSQLGLDVLNYVPDNSLAFDRSYFPAVEEEEEDVEDLRVVVRG